MLYVLHATPPVARQQRHERLRQQKVSQVVHTCRAQHLVTSDVLKHNISILSMRNIVLTELIFEPLRCLHLWRRHDACSTHRMRSMSMGLHS